MPTEHSDHTIGLFFSSERDQQLLEAFLESEGHAVRSTDRLQGGKLAREELSLMIADLPMARKYSNALLERKKTGSSFLPLLIALPDSAEESRWLEVGFDDVLRLPIRKAELRARLGVFLRLREQSMRRYQSFFENALAGLYRITPDGQFLMVNPKLLDMLGYDSLKELEAASESQKIGPAGHEATFRGLESKGAVTNLESSWTRRDGSTVWVLESARAVYDDDGNVLCWEGVVEDITERKRAEEALREAKEEAEASNRAKSAFLANMSHEIRTPLTGIIGFTSYLSKQVEDEGQRKFIELIEKSGQRLMDTLDALLTLAKLESNQADVQFELVNVAEEAEQVIHLFQEEAEAKDIDLRFNVEPDARTAVARLDQGALTSILQNLLSNALKFTEEGYVEVHIRVDDPSENGEAGSRQVQVRVEDTGEGVDPEFIPYLFDSFRQESTGHGREHEGSGLGLSIVSKLTEIMEGEIDVESTKGEGTAFTVSFPVVESESSPGQDQTEEIEADLSYDSCNVLLVEDNEETRFLLKNVLSEMSEVDATGDADEAMSMANEQHFDLVYVDINLKSGKSGIDVLKALRAQPEYVDVPVVAITAYAMPGDREEFLQAGFNHYLSKPFTADEILRLTSELLSSTM